jgi:hypothetical protein
VKDVNSPDSYSLLVSYLPLAAPEKTYFTGKYYFQLFPPKICQLNLDLKKYAAFLMGQLKVLIGTNWKIMLSGIRF